MVHLQPGRYITTFPCPVDQASRSLLEFCNHDKFSKMSDGDMSAHITAMRDEAYQTTSWPCLGWFLHMPPLIRESPPVGEYERTIQELIADRSRKVLDLGCMFGHDSRAMLQDGVEPHQVTAADLMPELLQLGHKLFADDSNNSPHLKGMTFHNVDVFKSEDTQKLEVEGGYHAIHIGAFLHLFPEQAQEKVVALMNRLLSKEPGSVIFGAHVGRLNAAEDAAMKQYEDPSTVRHGSRGTIEPDNGAGASICLHSPESFADLFAQHAGGPGMWLTHIEFKRYRFSDGDGEAMMSVERAEHVRSHLMAFALRRK